MTFPAPTAEDRMSITMDTERRTDEDGLDDDHIVRGSD